MPATHIAAPLTAALCLLAVAALVAADARRALRWRAVMKTAASLAFVAVALQLGALASPYGQAMLGALVLGAGGDVLLLSDTRRMFLAGLGAFLLSHLGFALAFSVGGLYWPVAAGAALPALALGTIIWRWLRPHLPSGFAWPVLAYVAAILLMCALAAGHAAHSGRWALLAAALLFAASDVAVARERFVVSSVLNRAWGLPTYYVAQLMFAWSVAG